MKSDYKILGGESENLPPLRPVPATDPGAGYLELLKNNPNFRLFWSAQMVSAAGDWFNNVALLGLVLQLTASGFASGMVLLTTSLPYFLLIPITGPIVDRFSR